MGRGGLAGRRGAVFSVRTGQGLASAGAFAGTDLDASGKGNRSSLVSSLTKVYLYRGSAGPPTAVLDGRRL